MKRTVFFTFFWGMFISASFSYSSRFSPELSSTHHMHKVHNEESLFLHGRLLIGEMRSLFPPLEATKTSSFITVHYLIHLSHIQVTVTDEIGQSVYSETVNLVPGNQLLIDISDWSNGSYTISFTSNRGGYLYGSFDIAN